MKKKGIKIIIAILCLGGIYTLFENDSNEQLTNLAFKNIEALAQGEGGEVNYVCINYGDIDCYGDKVEDMYTGFSLRP